MIITTEVKLAKDQTLLYTPDAAAAQVLAALGANPTVDSCIVYVISPSEPGLAGAEIPPATP